MKPLCHSLHPLDPASAAFFWRSKADTLLKVDLDIHRPGTAGRELLLDSNGSPIQQPDGSLTFEFPLPLEIPEEEQQDPTRSPILVNDDNDDLDWLFDGSSVVDPYPQDNDDSVLKLKDPDHGNNVLDDDDVVMVTLRKFDAIDTGKIKLTTSNNNDVQIFKYIEGDYELDAVDITELEVDLSNPGTSSPLRDLPNEDVSFYIEGKNANSDLAVYMILEDDNGNELARQEVHLEIVSTRIISLSAQGNGELSEFLVKSTLTDLMQGANIVRRDRDGLDANADVSVPVTFRLGQFKGMDNDATHRDWDITTSGYPEAEDILDYMRDFFGGLNIYIIDDITNAGGFARTGAGIMVIPAQGSPDDMIAHEWLHAFGDIGPEIIDDANDDGHICVENHLMNGSGCDPIQRGSDVRESEKDLFLPSTN